MYAIFTHIYHIFLYHIFLYHIFLYHIFLYHIFIYHIFLYHIFIYHIFLYHIFIYHVFVYIYVCVYIKVWYSIIDIIEMTIDITDGIHPNHMASSTTNWLHPCPAGSLRRDNSSDFDEFLHGVSLACGFRRRCRGHWPVERRGSYVRKFQDPILPFFGTPEDTRRSKMPLFSGFSWFFYMFRSFWGLL